MAPSGLAVIAESDPSSSIEGGVVDLGARFGARFPTLRDVLAAGALGELASAVKGAKADFALDRIAKILSGRVCVAGVETDRDALLVLDCVDHVRRWRAVVFAADPADQVFR